MNKKNKIIGSIIIVCIFLIFTMVGTIKYFNESKVSDEDIFVDAKTQNKIETAEKTTETSKDINDKKIIKVEIKGEVQKPGVYTMTFGNRLEDLILKAGGLKDNADKDSIQSMARKLRDEECIIINAKVDNANTSSSITNNLNNNQNKNNTAGKGEVQNNSNSSSNTININTASEEELEKIPGVGATIAKGIIEYREKNGGFNTIEDIKNVDRIGDKTFEKMKDKITIY